MKNFRGELFSNHSEGENQNVVRECSNFFVELLVELEVGHLPLGSVEVLGAVGDVS